MKIIQSIYCFLESMGRARAAAELSSLGRYQAARDLMEQPCEYC